MCFFLYNSTCFYGLACVSAKHVWLLLDISLGGDGGDVVMVVMVVMVVILVMVVMMVAYLFGLCFRKVHLRGPGGGLNRRSANNDDDIG